MGGWSYSRYNYCGHCRKKKDKNLQRCDRCNQRLRTKPKDPRGSEKQKRREEVESLQKTIQQDSLGGSQEERSVPISYVET